MSAEFLSKVATVLEEVAKVIDQHDVEQMLATKTAHAVAMKGVVDRYVAATGEEIPAEIFAKLSSSKEDVLSSVTQLLEKTAGSAEGVESLGRSSEKSAQKLPLTKKEAADAAYERFGNFINS